jgi:hypothetical protein
MEIGMKQLFIALAGFAYLYQGYNYPYYNQDYNYPYIFAPYHAPFVYNGVDRDFYNPSNERPGIAPGGASKKGDNCGSVIVLVGGCI